MHGVVHLVRYPLFATDEPAEVRPEVGLDRGDCQPAAVGCFVRVVTRVPAGEQPVARLRDDAGREVFVDRERHQREHTIGRGDVEIRTFTGRAATYQRGQDRYHCMHPAAGAVGNGRPGHRRAAVGGACVVARKPLIPR